MNVIVFEENAYYAILREVIVYVRNNLLLENQKNKVEKEDDWIPLEEAKKILNVKSKTKMQQLRNSGEIVFTKYGRKIKYSRTSLNNFLNQHSKTF